MKRIFVTLFLFSLCLLLSAEIYHYQGFEETSSDTWNYSANPLPNRLIYWGPVNTTIGSASAYEGDWYWAGWDLDNIPSSLTFDNVLLPLGYSYNLSFYYYTAGLSPATEYSRYAISVDGGISWLPWVELLPDSNAWTLENVDLPEYASQVMLKVEALQDGIAKFSHWDHFLLERTPIEPTPPVVYELSAAQRMDGSGLVDIAYSLFDANGDLCTVSLALADGIDADYSYNPDPANLSGDIGEGIAIGTNKEILWNALAEGITFDGSQYRLKVIADDETNPQVATPVIDPPSGTFDSPIEATISCATANAVIRYTIDGSEPGPSSVLYTEAISISSPSTLKARAFCQDWQPSETAVAVYEGFMPDGFVLIPGGTFTMGDTRGGGYSDELPTHSVTLNSFYLGTYEVTQAEYAQFMQPGSSWTSSYGLGDSYPAYYVSWYAILKYCNLRSMAEGLTPVYSVSGSTNPANWGTVPTSDNTTWNAAICNWNANGYRLPTEAEWEYAARGATNTPDYLYSGSDDINAVAWYSGNNSPNGSKPVGTKAPNGLGLYDMSGNVYEWCWDWYGSSYYSSSPGSNPTGPASGSSRVLRGGFWSIRADYCRVALRNNSSPLISYYSIGFRLCRAVP